jgi:hypothetical protein
MDRGRCRRPSGPSVEIQRPGAFTTATLDHHLRAGDGSTTCYAAAIGVVVERRVIGGDHTVAA